VAVLKGSRWRVLLTRAGGLAALKVSLPAGGTNEIARAEARAMVVVAGCQVPAEACLKTRFSR